MNLLDVAGEDIAVESDEVGRLPRFDGACFCSDAQSFGGFAGKRSHGLGQGDGLINVDRAMAVVSIGLAGSGQSEPPAMRAPVERRSVKGQIFAMVSSATKSEMPSVSGLGNHMKGQALAATLSSAKRGRSCSEKKDMWAICIAGPPSAS